MNKTIETYHQQADLFASQYDALNFEQVHLSWKAYWPKDQLVLDIGAGSGRDSLWLDSQGCQVIAIEPAKNLLTIGQQKTGGNVQWLDDSLPGLKASYQLNLQFNTILLSAVWTHILPSEQERAIRKMANLLAPGGRLVLTLRHGNYIDERASYPLDLDKIALMARQAGLLLSFVSDITDDVSGRTDVKWQTVILELPDDGSGSLSMVRHIVVNDSKSSTYKLALLRTLVRIAEAHPGAIVDKQDGTVAVSLGLVALYWIRLFKRLIDGNIQQSSDASKGLSFVKTNGWCLLSHLTADDFAIGNYYQGQEAIALQQLISDTLTTIKTGPVKYIWKGKRENQLFAMERAKPRRTSSVLIDKEFLDSFGSLILKEDMWRCFRHYGCWIEPLLVQQWIAEMKKYELNQQHQHTLETYHQHLQWFERHHDTSLVRKKVDQLLRYGIDVQSVWSGNRLASYDVDHCVPFSYWPNNDLWNLLPASRSENRVKRDRLPSQERLKTASKHIKHWWQQAWGAEGERQRFFIEASLSLPNITHECRDYDEVFHALQVQVIGVKQRLQIREW